MKNSILLGAGALLIATGCNSKDPAAGPRGEGPAARTGKSAPDFTLKDPDGKSVPLSGFRGKAVLLNFWGIG